MDLKAVSFLERKGFMRSFAVTVMLAAFVLCWSGGLNSLPAAEKGKESKQTVTGTVEAASPCGTVLKVTRAITPCGSRTETLTFQANSGELKKQVQDLKKGSAVTLTYVTCPKTKKLMLTQIEQESSNAK
jgi:hypothetical protein